jgi:hypothetical protein
MPKQSISGIGGIFRNITLAWFTGQVLLVLGITILGFNVSVPALALLLVALGGIALFFSPAWQHSNFYLRHRFITTLILWFLILPTIAVTLIAFTLINSLITSRLAFLPINPATTILQWTISLIIIPGVIAFLIAEPSKRLWTAISTRLLDKPIRAHD